MQELNTINSLLGGHAITVKGFRSLLGNRKKITVCELGCGGGDNLAAIVKWCNKHRVAVRCVGIDLKEECIEVARQQPLLKKITQWVTSDYATVNFDIQPDIVFSSLFCHHFTDEQLVQQLQWMRQQSRIGFFINDLQRHWLAYRSIKLLTGFFSTSYLVKNDAPVSVTRGFVRNEWQMLCDKAGLQRVEISWQWAFRYLVSQKNA